MTASEYLDGSKRRLLRIGFPEFDLYDTYSGLLGVHLTDVMSDSPDVRIGDLVVPELTLTLSYQGKTDHDGTSAMTELAGAAVTAEAGLEQSREDITEELSAIYAASGSGKLVYARSANGCYFVADGKNLYGCRFGESSGRAFFDSEFESVSTLAPRQRR